MDSVKFTALAVLFVVFVVAVLVGDWVFRSSMEAAAFNRVTGKKVSTWDAMWIELRVQEQTR